MDSLNLYYLMTGLGGAAAGAALVKVGRRLQLSRAKHASLAGHPRWAKRIAGLIPFYEFDAAQFFSSDGAPGEVARQRQLGFEALAQQYRQRFARTIALKTGLDEALSDLKFTEAYRVPYQYSRRVRECLGGSPLLEASHGVTLTDVDGNDYYDVAGSYGVNLFGYDFYKGCIERGAARVAELGPRRGLLPHVGNRGGHAGGAARPLPHGSPQNRALLRGLPRLVGRCATRHRQSDPRRRQLHLGGPVGSLAQSAGHAPGYCVRAGQPAAVPASQSIGSSRLGAGRWRRRRRL